MPNVIDVAIALPVADLAKTTFTMQGATRPIVSNNLRL